MSVPVPMAIPTSACASAGASLMPSPDHRHHLTPGLEALHLGHLPLGAHVGHYSFDAGRTRDGLGRGSMIARQHDHVQLQGPELSNGVAGAGLHRVGDGDHRGQPPVHRDEDGRLRLRRPGIRDVAQR